MFEKRAHIYLRYLAMFRGKPTDRIKILWWAGAFKQSDCVRSGPRLDSTMEFRNATATLSSEP
jgi:hypothetical protein